MNENLPLITISHILSYFPIHDPYRFIDDIIEIDQDHIVGSYTFKKEEFFFKGHFAGVPVTPGAILQEAGAQIGLVAFGMYILGNQYESITDLGEEFVSPEIKKLPGIAIGEHNTIRFYLVDAEMKFKKVIEPGETIVVRSEKVFFKLNKLKCNIKITTLDGALVCKGVLAGMVHLEKTADGE